MRRRVMPGMVSREIYDQWFGRALTEFRQKWRTTTVKQAAEATGLDRNQISRWVNCGDAPGVKTLERFKTACRLSGIEVPE
jgi:transcriptional regulator with XRE-family HTH domain